MAPLSRSKATTLLEARDDGTKVYSATVDPEWTAGSLPFGGYALSLILNAAMQYQRNTANEDPLEVTCFFFRDLSVPSKRTEVHVRSMPGDDAGKVTKLQVDLYQDGALKLYAHLVFGMISPNTRISTNGDLEKSVGAICPLSLHPSSAKSLSHERFRNFTFRKHLACAADPSVGVGHHDAVLGCWTELSDESGPETLEADMLGVFVNIATRALRTTMTDSDELDGYRSKWRPVTVLSIDFRTKLPLVPMNGDGRLGAFAPTTLGALSRKPHIRNGRHTDVVELWTAPSRIAEQDHAIDAHWREKMVCVAVGSRTEVIVRGLDSDDNEGVAAKL